MKYDLNVDCEQSLGLHIGEDLKKNETSPMPSKLKGKHKI